MTPTRRFALRFKSAALACAIALAFASAARAEKTLSKEEAAAGWINLFDGDTLFGWNRLGDAAFRVADGAIVCGEGSGGWIATTSQFADFELVIKIKVRPDTAASVSFRAPLDGHPSENGAGYLYLQEPKGSEGKEHEVKVTADGQTLSATIDGDVVEGLTCSNAKGHVGIAYHGRHFSNKQLGKIEVSEARLRPLNLKPIFNGKDLTEWNIIPGRKSEFTVVEGAINIKNGNGQIESKATFKDLTLQLDIFSNGEHLNSGVFYRGPVGVFWKGYESQVRNHWDKDDRTKPVDFGTGGNYGNQNSRKVVSSDKEWFTKTVVVDGAHASVWINGYLTSDFTDVRPVSPENDGKNGYVPGPGTIHLQGHDPTTDLSFKNIRAAELPK